MSNKPLATEEEIYEVIKNLNIKTGIGDPSSEVFGQTLTEEEEKKVDSKGCPIVDGLPWSDAGTGLYLTIAVSPQAALKANKKIIGGTTFPVSLALSSLGLHMTVVTTEGRPTFSQGMAGAALEVPSDLGRDSIKRKYVVEWIRDTAAEALALNGVDLGGNKAAYQHLGLTVAMSAEQALVATGL
jgi:hypothetical protein